jgi:hypothetical protein
MGRMTAPPCRNASLNATVYTVTTYIDAVTLCGTLVEMSRKKDPAVRDLQPVLVRVPDEVFQVFQIARAAYGHRSLQELLRPVLEAHADYLRAKAPIQAMLKSRAELQAEESGTLRRLPEQQLPRSEGRDA